MLFRCAHQWEILKEETLPSAYEQMADGSGAVKQVKHVFDPFTKTSITILQCKKCGKLDKTIVKNPE